MNQRWNGRAGFLVAAGVAVVMVSCGADTPASSRQSLNSTPQISQFVLYAARSVSLGSFSHADGGDIGVGSTTVSSFGPQLLIGDNALLDLGHTSLAPSVQLGVDAQVGDVQTNALQNQGATKLGTVAAFSSASMPPLPLALPLGGGSDVAVGSHGTVALQPGTYGALTVAEYGTVTLAAGTYSFSSVTMADHSALSGAPGGVDVRISGTLSVDEWAKIGPLGDQATAGELSIAIAGNDGVNGSPPAASFGAHDHVQALVAAPHGTVSLGDQVLATGAFAGFDVTVGQHALLTFQSGFAVAPPGQQGSQTVTGNVPPAVATAPILGSLPNTTVLTLNIALPLQLNGAPGSGFPPITTFIEQLSDLTSASRPAPLTPAGFAAAYGPTTTDYDSLKSFVTANGLTVARTFTARNMLTVMGTAAAIESAFFVNLDVYQRPDGTTFYAPASDPSLNLSVPILDISGLDDFAQPFHSGGTTSSNCGQSPIGTQAAFYGADFVNAYFSGCASLLGQGQNQTVALLELDSYVASDITAFVAGTVLGETALAVPANLTNVTQEVVPSSTPIPFGTVTFAPNNKPVGGQDGEVDLDISMVLSVAPKANLIVYEDNTGVTSPVPFSALLAQMADDDLAQTISSSWSWTFSTNNAQLADQSVFYQYAAQSQSFFEASGDLGAYVASSPYNSSFSSPQPTVLEPIMDSPFITVVGGTELTTTGTPAGTVGAYTSETTWNDTSFPRYINGAAQNTVSAGGFCTGTSPNVNGALGALPIPTWQVGVNSTNTEVNNNPSNARMIPDVSLVATGIGIVFNGSASCTGGTSAAAPLWAAFMALVNEANGAGATPVGFVNPALYRLAAASASNFNDIADGSNNDWFDDGQQTEGANDGAGTPSPPISQTVSSTTPPVTTSSALSGAPTAGTSEATGLYHAVAGYDLATGLGTPTCGLLSAMAPSLSPTPPPPPPPAVTITYEQVAACLGFEDSVFGGGFVSSGDGFAFAFFGITQISNSGTTPFTVQLANMYVAPNLYASDVGSLIAENVYEPFAEPATQVIAPGQTLSFSVDAIVGVEGVPANPPANAPTTVGGFFLNYALDTPPSGTRPSNAPTDPQVVFVKSNASTTSFPITGLCTDIIF